MNTPKQNILGGAEVLEITLKSFLTGPDGTGVVVDLKDIYSEINIYEDLFNNTITGNIILIDSLNLLNKIPIIAQESITIRFKTSMDFSDLNEDGIKEITLRVSGISGKVLSPNRKSYVYTIELTSMVLMTDLTRRINQSYKGNIGTTINDIFDAYIKPFDMDYSSFFDEPKLFFDVQIANEYSCIVPNLSPLETINWLLTRSVVFDNPLDVSCILYHNSNSGNYVVSSLNTLLNKPKIVQTYYYGNVFSGGNTQYGERNRSNVFNIVHSFDISETNDLIENTTQGLFSGSLYEHDLIKKTIELKKYNYNSFVFSDRSEEDGKNPILPTKNEFVTSTNSKVAFYSKRDSLNDALIEQDIEKHTSRIFERRSLLNQIQLFRINLSCYGDSRRTVGERVTFIAPPAGSVDEKSDNIFDKNLSGEYLITALHHKITLDTYDMVMEISKNSAGVPIPSETKLEIE